MEFVRMIRAESPLEVPAEIAQRKNGADEARRGQPAVPAATAGENRVADKLPEAHAAETDSKPMHPDSARYTPQQGAVQPAHVSGGSITCPECGMANVAAGGRRFCGDCGASLWEKCHACGGDVPADERFCGQCGVNMAESVQQQVQNIREHLAKAERLELECRFSEAKVLLASIAKAPQARMKTYAEDAQQRLQRVRHEQDRWEHAADAAHAKAKEALAACDFDGAIRILEEIPRPVRSTPMETMLQETYSKKAEVDELAGQLRRLLAEKRGGDVLPIVERLQRLHPGHPLAGKIAVRMRDQLVAKAEAKIADGRYDEALQLLRRIPSSTRTSHSESLLQDADELSALCWHANHSQYVDDALKEVLKRLLHRLPKDATSQKLAAEYKKRRKRLDDPQRAAPVPWAKSAETPWKCPVHWKFGAERIELNEIPPAVLRDHPGAFAIAFGLALQGIDKGPVHFDFREEDSGGVIGRVAKLMREKRHGSAWGIDIGDHSLKVVKLRTLEGGRRVEAVVCEAIPHRKLLSQAADYGEARDLAEESFDKFRSVHALKGERLCAALPGRLTISRTLHLPPTAGRKVEDMLRYEARHLLPGDLGDYCWRSYSPGSDEETSKDRRTDHLLLALTRRHIEYAYETFNRLNIQPDVVQCEHLALHNFLEFELAADERNGDGRRGATVLLDMGSGGTNMIVHSSRYLWSRYLGVGGYTFTRAVLREFNLTLQQAEEWKRDLTNIDRWSRWEAAIGPVFESFCTEFKASLDAFAKDYPSERIERILTLGGGIQTPGLLRYLRAGR